MSEDQIITRTCRHCNAPKSIDEFPLTRGQRFFKCMACITAQSMEWQRANREQSNAIKRAWVSRNPDLNREVQARFRAKESVKVRARKRKSERQHIVNSQARDLYAKDPSKFKARIARRDEREAKAEGVFTKRDEREMFINQGGKCANPACRADLRVVKYQADHVLALVHGGTHWPSNRKLLCLRCNHIKSARRPEDWEAITRDPDFMTKWNFPINPADPLARGAR